MYPVLARLLREIPRPDLIEAHFIYPAGVAAVWLSRRFGLPVVLTFRGPAATRRHAEAFGWQDTTDGQLAVFRDVLHKRQQRTAP